MKRILMIGMCLLTLWGCADNSGGVLPDRGETAAVEEEPEETATGMDDLLKITTWVMDPALEGKGYWAYTDDYRTYKWNGYWVPNEGESDVDEDQVFFKEVLEPGMVYTMAPMGFHGTANLNLHFEFDGMVTVGKTEPDDNTILTVFNVGDRWSDQWTGEKTVSGYGPCTVNILPLGKEIAPGGVLVWSDTLAGKEYLLTVKGYALDGTLMVTVKIRLESLVDEAYPYEDVVNSRTGGFGEIWQKGEERTRFCSVEILSYEYSDQYKMMITE